MSNGEKTSGASKSRALKPGPPESEARKSEALGLGVPKSPAVDAEKPAAVLASPA